MTNNTTEPPLSDLERSLYFLVLDPKIVRKIIIYLEKWGRLSAPFLIHKFHITLEFADQIMAVLNRRSL